MQNLRWKLITILVVFVVFAAVGVVAAIALLGKLRAPAPAGVPAEAAT